MAGKRRRGRVARGLEGTRVYASPWHCLLAWLAVCVCMYVLRVAGTGVPTQGPCSFVRVATGCNGGWLRRLPRAGGNSVRIAGRRVESDRHGDSAAWCGDGRRADGILWSVQYVPICRHVLSIPSAPSASRNPTCLPACLLGYLSTYLPTLMPHGIVTSIPSYAR